MECHATSDVQFPSSMWSAEPLLVRSKCSRIQEFKKNKQTERTEQNGANGLPHGQINRTSNIPQTEPPKRVAAPRTKPEPHRAPQPEHRENKNSRTPSIEPPPMKPSIRLQSRYTPKWGPDGDASSFTSLSDQVGESRRSVPSQEATMLRNGKISPPRPKWISRIARKLSS